MKNPRSSSRSDIRAWQREPWPWLLIAGPALVVVASLASAWLAISSDDGLVASNYYKRGLLINRTLEAQGAGMHASFGAIIRFAPDGTVQVRLDEAAGQPATLSLVLAHVAHRPAGETVALRRDGNGDYVGHLTDRTPGQRIVTLQSETWQLPTTVASSLGEVRLQSATPLAI